MDDYFAELGFPRQLGLDGGELQRRFHELSRRYHPDFHESAPAAERAAALAASARVNRAYRALRDPLARVGYLVALEEGREAREGDPARAAVGAELLAEMMEVQEALEEARASGLDQGARERLQAERERLRGRFEAEAEEVLARIPEWDSAPTGSGERRALLAWFKQRLAVRAYLRTVIGDLDEALGEGNDGHGSHRRH